MPTKMLGLIILVCVSSLDAIKFSGPPGPPATAPGLNGPCSSEGHEFSNFNFWYRCQRDAESKELTLKVMGCMARDDPLQEHGATRKGKRIDNGATFHFRDTVIQCLHDEPTDTWTQTPIGCLGNPSQSEPAEHKVGEKWEEGEGTSGDSRIKYKMRCDRNGFTVTKQAVKCIYNSNGEQGELDGGCMKKFGDILVQCVKREQKGSFLRAQIVIAPNEKVEQDATDMGVKYC